MNDDHLSDTDNLTDNVKIAIEKYQNHPSLLTISRLVTRRRKF